MGLLDQFDPGALSLLAAAGPTSQPMSLGQRLFGAMQQQQAMRQADEDRKLKQQMQALQMQLIGAQIGDTKAQEAQRNAAAQKAANLQAMLASLDNQGSASQYGVGGGGISMGGVREPMREQPGGLAGIPIETIAKLKANGVDLLDAWKTAVAGIKQDPGAMYNKGGQMTYIPDVKSGLNFVNGQVSALPGAAAAQAEIAGATSRAQEGAKAAYDLVQGVGPDNKPGFLGTRASIVESLSAPQTQEAPGGLKLSPLEAAQEILRRTGDKSANFNLGGATGRVGQQRGFFATGLSPAEKTAAEADTAYATERAKSLADQAKSIYSAAQDAPTKIAQLNNIGSLLSQHEGGRLSGAAMKFASAANSMGIKLDPKLGDKEAAHALSREIALQLRNTGSGAGMPGQLSNQDRDYLESMTPNIAQSVKGRQQLIDTHVAVMKRQMQVAEFARRYESKYGKLDNAFFSQLQSWANENNLFGGK